MDVYVDYSFKILDTAALSSLSGKENEGVIEQQTISLITIYWIKFFHKHSFPVEGCTQNVLEGGRYNAADVFFLWNSTKVSI